MANNDKQILTDNLEELLDAQQWLQRSYDICKSYRSDEKLSPEQLDNFEALTSRYARLVDFLLNKVFRSIDSVELESGGSLIDVVNRSAKRGIVDSVDAVRDMKDLRNEISHEYARKKLQKIFFEVLSSCPELFQLVQQTEKYCSQIS